MAKVVIEFQNKDDAIKASRAEVDRLKEALAKAKAEAKELKNGTGELGLNLGEMARNALSFAAGMAGVNSASAIAGQIIAMAKEDFRQLVEIQSRAAAAQAGLSGKVGKLVINSALGETAEQKALFDFARTYGAKMGPGGAEKMLEAAVDVQNAMPTVPLAKQQEALVMGMRAASIDPSLSAGGFATSVLTAQRELERANGTATMEQASNLVLSLAARTGGDFASMQKQIPRWAALAGGVTKTEAPDVFALGGFLSQKLADPTGEQTTTTLGALLGRVNTRDITLGGKRMQFKGQTGIDKLVEIAQGIEGGAFGDQSQAIADFAKSVGRDSTEIKLAMAAIAKGGPELQEARARLAASVTGGGSLLSDIEQRKALIMPASRGVQATREAAGAASVALGGNTSEGDWGQVRERMQAFVDQYGITTGFDAGKDLRDFIANKAGENPIEWEKRERRRLMRNAISGRAGISDTTMAPGMGAVPAVNPLGGMSEEQMLRAYAQNGATPAEGGVSLLEQAAFQTVGISPDTIDKWNEMFKAGLREELKTAFVEAMKEVRQTGSNALNPGG